MTQQEYALARLLELGPRLLEFIFSGRGDWEEARKLHTELRELLEHARGAATW
jgi:hypothetical protein